MDLQVRVSGRSQTQYGLELSCDFWLQGAFLHRYSASLILYCEGFSHPSLCPCHDYSHEMVTRDKDWLLTVFLWLVPFQRANRRLAVNSSTWVHLSVASGNARRRLADGNVSSISNLRPNRSRRGGKNTRQKGLNDLDDHDGVITHLEPNILECKSSGP